MMLSRSAVRPAGLRTRTPAVRVTPCPYISRPGCKVSSPLVAKAQSSPEMDFDTLLIKLSEKFEATENKPLLVGYIAAGVTAIVLSEYLIHLPLLDVLLGFPVQFVGLIALPWLAVRYAVDKKDVLEDANAYWASISSKLPSIDKK